jgi:hypothetical protein
MARGKSLLDGRAHASLLALGAAIENIFIAAAHRGYRTEANWFPFGNDAPVVAGLRFTPIASAEVASLAEAFDLLRARVTNRRLADRKPLEPSVMTALHAAASSSYGGRLELLTGDGDLAEVGRILGRGDRVRVLCRELHHQMMAEVRWSKDEAMRTQDGIDLESLELSLSDRAAMRLLARPDIAALARAQGGGVALEEGAQKSIAASSAVGLLTLRQDSHDAWLQGGRAFQRVWLTATRLGIALQPMTALLYMIEMLNNGSEVFTGAERATLRELESRLDGLFEASRGAPKSVLFRLVYAPEPSSRSLRIPADWMLHAGLPDGVTG